MSTAIWPPISSEQLRKEEELSLARELEWLLASLQDTLTSLKAGLEDCATLLSPDKGPSTLALSSLRSESLKGFVVRVGSRILKGDITLKLATIVPPKGQPAHKLSISSTPQAPILVLEQLTSARNLINGALDIIDISKWTGDARNAEFIAGQLKLLLEHVQEAKQNLKGNVPNQVSWWEKPVDEEMFDPPCPSNIDFHLSIYEAAILLQIRALEPADQGPAHESITGFSIRDRFAVALGHKVPTHDEIDDVFEYRGEEVKVKEKVRVESQDPSLLAAMAKLGALEHSVAMSLKALNTVMGKED